MEAKKIYRDTLFRAYFKEPQNFIQLCNAVTGLNIKAEQLTENTVEDILFDGFRNDVSFNAGGNCFIFCEHQSTRNFNMPLRMLFYLSMLYRKTVNKDFLYREKLIELPAPKFFVFYNGKEPCPEETVLKLSDAFSIPSDIELSVKVYNINYNRNFRLVRNCLPIHDYSCFIDKVLENIKAGMDRDNAIIGAMKWCRKNNIMRDFLEAHWEEVFFMVTMVWDAEEAKNSYIAQGREEGKLEMLLENIRRTMKNYKVTAEEAMNGLEVSPEQQKKLAPLI